VSAEAATGFAVGTATSAAPDKAVWPAAVSAEFFGSVAAAFWLIEGVALQASKPHATMAVANARQQDRASAMGMVRRDIKVP
jgi:hypothetical protein